MRRCGRLITLLEDNNFRFDLTELAIPEGTTLAVIVNPNSPNGGIFVRHHRRYDDWFKRRCRGPDRRREWAVGRHPAP